MDYMTEFSPDNNTHVYQVKDKEASPIDLLKDTVGWVGKNLLEIPSSVTTQEINGVTFTVTRNADGEVTEIDANGTASAVTTFGLGHSVYSANNYSFNGCPSNGSSSSYRINISKLEGSAETGLGYDYGSGYDFTLSENTDILSYIRIASGYTCNHVKFYPMLRKASIADSTYEPYHKSVEAEIEQVYADNGVLGASNFIYVERETRTYNGVTFTRIDDKSFSLSGTATGDANLDITRYVNPPIGRKYTYSIEEEGANKVDYIRVTKDGTEVLKSSEKSADIDISSAASNGYVFQITVVSGKTYNTTIKPMLTLASDTYKGFRPYAMTNRELTEKAFLKQNAISSSDDLNNIKTDGVYAVTTAPTHSPENTAYCILIVKRYSGEQLIQVIYKHDVMYSRRYFSNQGNLEWSAWYKFTGTVVS